MNSQNPLIAMIQSRRSVRRYTGAKVERSVLEELVRVGMAAPTAHDLRHWHFIIVDDPKLIDQMASCLPHAKMLTTARHAIIVLSDVTQAYGGEEFPYWIQDCSAVTENILLAAHAIGLGACWTGVHPRLEREALLRGIIAFPENIRPFCVIALGYPEGESALKDKASAERIRWNSW